MRTKSWLTVLIGMVLLLSFEIGLKDAQADALLFPWIIKSDHVSNVISVVNTAQTDAEAVGQQTHDNRIYIQYWYKETTANTQTERCLEYDFMCSSSMFDLVTFDVSGIVNSGLPMFNDTNDPIFAPDMTLPVENPRRGFLIVTNNTDALIDAGTNLEGTLYGEALIVDHVMGAAFGYIAYNAKPGGVATEPGEEPLDFDNGKDRNGEAIAPGELGRVVLFPPEEYNTRFFVTPIMRSPLGAVGPGQRVGNANVSIQFCAFPEVGVDGYPTGNCELPGFWINDEVVISSNVLKNIACTSADNLEAFMGAAAFNYFVVSGKAGWTYILTHPGSLEDDLYRVTDQAVVAKLVWKLDSHDISFSEECNNCRRECLSNPFCKSFKPNKKCTDDCNNKCKYICDLPSRSIPTEQSDFQWIRGDDSMPYVFADGE
jgi:hypothetical protein